jgi:hypothetical protein
MGLAMQKKITRPVVLLMLCFLALSIFFACVEEPFIEPSVIPYSVIRVGNLTTNIEELVVVIDGEFPVPELQSLSNNEFTDHFDLVAGRRYFALVNPANGDTIYRKWIQVQSFEEQTYWYAGFWNQSIDTSSADFFLHSDAFTYLEKDPPEGHLNAYFLHAAGTTPDSAAIAYNVEAAYDSISGSDTTRVVRTLVEDLLFGEIGGAQLPEYEYKINIRRAEDDVLVSDYIGTFSAGNWSWIYITGDPGAPVVVREDKEPTPARPKN